MIKFERQLLLRALACGLVPVVIALVLIWTRDLGRSTRITLSLVTMGSWWLLALSLRSHVVYPLRTLSNLIEALREGDYSMRLSRTDSVDALGELMAQINQLTATLQERRFSGIEATALLRKILGQIDVALFGFDQDHYLCLVNDSATAALGQPETALLGRTAEALGLESCLTGKAPRPLELALAGGMRRWELRRATYRDQGVTHQLVFLFDLTRTLHQEERLAWKRLIQILRHELNNSLTPIQSVAQTLLTRVRQDPDDPRMQDLQEGLQIIAARSEELGRFINAYSTLTRLPDPVPVPLQVGPWIRQITGMESRLKITVDPGPDVTIQADKGQLEQALINLLSNGIESAREHQGDDADVTVTWAVNQRHLRILVLDNGAGLDPARDVFVPFFTTKPQGCGIGLTLSRQIAEAHHGDLTLENRQDGPGCVARLTLPLTTC